MNNNNDNLYNDSNNINTKKDEINTIEDEEDDSDNENDTINIIKDENNQEFKNQFKEVNEFNEKYGVNINENIIKINLNDGNYDNQILENLSIMILLI